ncbi:MAG: TonB-dependent receptor [Xanthomonadales bacterium]|nr:TonB-dependent receptor [Xanthomonadales bacterium]
MLLRSAVRQSAANARRLAVAICLLVNFYLVVNTAQAEEQPLELNELLVSAALEPLSAADVASSVTVITREQIEQRQVKYLSELLRDVPGFAVSQSGGPGTLTQIRVRGAEANQLLVLIDGVRANDPASSDEFQFQFASTANIERIEIIRGPQSAIWGTDALAGVINIIRRKDVAEDYLAATAEYGSFNSLDLALDGGVSRENLRLSGGLSYMNTDGTNISRQGSEDDAADNTTANLALEWAIHDSWALLFSGHHVDATSDFDDFDYFSTGLPIDADLATRAQRDYLKGEARWQPTDSAWNGSLTAGWQDSDNRNFANGVWDSATSANTLEFRARASVLLDDREARNHRLSFALDQEEVDFSQRGIAFPWGDPNQDQSYDVTGYAAEYVGKPTGSFSWTLNGRQDDYSDFDDVFTWQLAASQRIGDNLRLRAAAGTGSKAPTFVERFGFYPDFFSGNPNLKPETSKGWELGVELGLLEQSLLLGAAWFDQQLEDEIDGFVFDPTTGAFTAVNKSGDSERRGLELTASGQLADAFSLNASYTYLDASETNSSGDSVREARRPRHMASLNANYSFAAQRGNLNLNLNYNGAQLDNFFPPPFYAPEQVVLDGFTVAGMAASWKLTDSLELTGRISNLLDEDYEEILGFARPGRAVYAGLRGRFMR